jgi:hypothetical protein
MRTPRALLHAMRNRRAANADGDLPALDAILQAASAPATAEELKGEKAAVAAFTAHRRSAARAARRPARTRTAIVSFATGLALLALGGTAAAARTGNLPQEAQQHAHRLFSALGVPAPRTPGATHTPTPTSTPTVIALGWCDAWGRHPSTGTPLSSENRRKLVAAAGGEAGIGRYCAQLRQSASPSPSRTAAPRHTPAPTTGSSPASSAPTSEPTSPTPTGTPTTEGTGGTAEPGEAPTPDGDGEAVGAPAHPAHPTHPAHPSHPAQPAAPPASDTPSGSAE